MTELRVTVTNTSNTGGTFLTPFYFGFHDGGFDLFEAGEEASAGLEQLAEDGSPMGLAMEREMVSPGSQGLVVTGAGGPFATGEVTAATIEVDATLNTHLAYAAMLLPSNDAFVGNDEALRLFSDSGRFLGAQTVTIQGTDVYDAGTELNTEEDAAFINQTAPNTGLDENDVVRLHGGFNGSEGNPDGTFGFDTVGAAEAGLTSGEQIILGGANAFGAEITEAADFTREGAQIAELHINTVLRREGTDGTDIIVGLRDDDLINAGAGNDVLLGGSGFDVLNGEDGIDFILGGNGNDEVNGGAGDDFARGGNGNDRVDGGEGDDRLGGNSGDDQIGGGAGDDFIAGGRGDDLIVGGLGDDVVSGGLGDDTFVFASGDGEDTVRWFNKRGDDTLVLSIAGIDDFEDVLEAATQERFGTQLDFGEEGSIFLRGTRLEALDEDDFIFVPDELLA
ncbi:MAG: spondin domain-containing protein [Pseudomonadota bacterium]